MTDQTPTLPPPSAPEPKRSWWKRKAGPLPVWAWIVGVIVGLGVIGALTEPPEDKEASADAAVTVPATSAAPAVTQAPTPATESPTTTEPPTTTTTTTSMPPTTINPGFLFLSQLQDGGNPEAVGLLTDALEPAVFERVDVVNATIAGPGAESTFVISATSGFAGDEYRRKAAEEGVAALAVLWGPDQPLGTDPLPVSLDYTVDGKHWLIPSATMKAVANRQMSPADALDSSG